MIRTHASLFSGIGGAEIAASWMGWDNVFHCEIQEFPRRVLEYWYPNSKSYEDITKTSFTEWRDKIDILTGGFPCQPFSCAGQRRGADDDRYLWPEMLRAVREIQPSWVVGENVAGLLTMVQPGEEAALGRTDDIFEENYVYRKEQRFTLDEICEGLEREGYAVQPFVVPACAVGAPHRRDRIWIVANRSDAGPETLQQEGKDGVLSSGLAADTKRCGRREIHDEVQSRQPNGQSAYGNGDEWSVTHPDEHRHTPRQACGGVEGSRRRDVPQPGERRDEAERPYGLPGLQRPAGNAESARSERECESGQGQAQPYGRGREKVQYPWRNFPTQSPVCSRDDGVSLGLAGITFPKWRAEAVKALGNAWVPQVAYEIFRAIKQVDDNEDADI